MAKNPGTIAFASFGRARRRLPGPHDAGREPGGSSTGRSALLCLGLVVALVSAFLSAELGASVDPTNPHHGVSPSAQSPASQERPPRPIELLDLFALFAFDETDPSNIQSWRVAAEPGSPIRWVTEGIQRTGAGSMRQGGAIVTIRGKPLTVLRRYIEPHEWRITLFGARAGVLQIEISSIINSDELALHDRALERLLGSRGVSVTPVKCLKNLASSGIKVYEIKIPKKKVAWLSHAWSCGSAGCSADLVLFLDRKLVDTVGCFLDE